MSKKNLKQAEAAAPAEKQTQATAAEKKSLAGTAFVYNGKTYVLQDGPVNFETKIPQPQISLNPTMSFISDGQGGAKLKITPNPTAGLPEFGGAPKKAPKPVGAENAYVDDVNKILHGSEILAKYRRNK